MAPVLFLALLSTVTAAGSADSGSGYGSGLGPCDGSGGLTCAAEANSSLPLVPSPTSSGFTSQISTVFVTGSTSSTISTENISSILSFTSPSTMPVSIPPSTTDVSTPTTAEGESHTFSPSTSTMNYSSSPSLTGLPSTSVTPLPTSSLISTGASSVSPDISFPTSTPASTVSVAPTTPTHSAPTSTPASAAPTTPTHSAPTSTPASAAPTTPTPSVPTSAPTTPTHSALTSTSMSSSIMMSSSVDSNTTSTLPTSPSLTPTSGDTTIADLSSTPTLVLPSTTPAVPGEEEEEEEEGEGTQQQLTLMVVSAVGGATVLILLLIVVVFGTCTCRRQRSLRILRRRRKMVIFSNREMVPVRRNQSVETTPNHHHHHRPAPSSLAKQPQTYTDLFSHIVEENLPIIEMAELQAYVDALEEDQAMDEYLEVLEMDVTPYNFTASLKCNRNKNRYVDILANDFTRVHLHTPGGHTRYSDYINANYIEGYKKRKEYIAAQGPLEKTGADFWSMVWSEKCANIVMVTNLVEDHRLKCFKYWPSEGVLLAHSLSIVLQDEQTLPNYTIRTFKVTLKDERYEDSGECREVTQFHFTAWPDHGVPESTDSMLEFVHRVRSAILPSHGPVIIHCSAGVGRSGTFIAIDVMLQKLEMSEPLDIMNWVCRMRAQRGSMVQTSWQYMFIYKALAHAAAEVRGEAASWEAGEAGEAGEGVEGGEAGEGGVSSQEDSSHTALSQAYQADGEDEGKLMSLPSFSSDDFLDMHIV